MMLERQREGIVKPKAEGRYRGRKPTARAKSAEVHALKAEGVSLSEIARRLGIGSAGFRASPIIAPLHILSGTPGYTVALVWWAPLINLRLQKRAWGDPLLVSNAARF
jgi:hypothetical protein